MHIENIDQYIVESYINQSHRQWLYEREIESPDCNKIKPLSLNAAKYIHELEKEKVFAGITFPEETHRLSHLFERIDILNIENQNVTALQNWLQKVKTVPSQDVVLSVSEKEAYWLPWDIIMQYADIVFYGFNKSIFDKSFDWWLIYHSDEVLTFCEKKLF